LFIGLMLGCIQILKIIIQAAINYKMLFRDLPLAFCSWFIVIYLFIGAYKKTKQYQKDLWDGVNFLLLGMGIVILFILFIKPDIFFMNACYQILHPNMISYDNSGNVVDAFTLVNRIFWHIFIAGMTMSWLIVYPFHKITIKKTFITYICYILMLFTCLFVSWIGYAAKLTPTIGNKQWTGFNDIMYWDGTFKFMKYFYTLINGPWLFSLMVTLFYAIAGAVLLIIIYFGAKGLERIKHVK